jgi:hypothetical protein
VNAATSSNTPNTIVKRDETGGFAAGAITSTSINTETLTSTSVVTNTLKVTGGSYTLTNAVLTTDGTGNAVWSSSGLYTLNGLTAPSQTFSTTTDLTSTIPSFTSSGTVHTLNIPMASEDGTIAGLISKEDYVKFNIQKVSNVTEGQGIEVTGQSAGGIGSQYSVEVAARDATTLAKGIIQLTNDLGGTAELPTVNTVGGVASSTITSIASSVLSATANNTADRIVQRDGSGGFAAGTITAGTLSSTTTNAGILTAGTTTLGNTTVGGTLTSTTINAGSLTTGTLRVTGGTLAQGSVLTSDANGNATWGSNGLYSLNGQGATTHTFVTANTASSDFTITSALGTGTLSNTAIHTFNLPDAGVSTRGVVTTSAQTFAGSKTFSGTTTLGALKVTGGTPTTVGYVLSASNTDGTVTWAPASAGISGVGTITTTSNSAGATISGTTLVLAAANGSNGGVLTSGTQTIGGEKSFTKAVTGAPAVSVATVAGTGNTITVDFSNSNLAYTGSNPQNTFTLTNIKDGGTYTFAVQGTTSGTSTFSSTGFNFISLGGNVATVSGKQTVYTFMVMGTTVYYSSIFQN